MTETITRLYEDEDLVVINKPAGIVVNDADTVAEETIQGWFAAEGGLDDSLQAELIPDSFDDQYGTPAEIFHRRGGIVHRLDKDTSGALVLAKHPGSLVALLAAFKQRQVEKQYLCLVHGKMRVEADTIRTPIGRASFDRKKFTTRVGGRPAETRYEVEQFYPHLDEDQVVEHLKSLYAQHDQLPPKARNFKKRAKIYQGFSLVRCYPKTGRTHQIRVHMASLQHPLVADSTYAGKKRAKLDPLWCPRQFLHAAEITIPHPRTGVALTVQAPLAADLEQAVSFLNRA